METTPLERVAQAISKVRISRDETYDGAYLVTGDPFRYPTNDAATAALATAQARAAIEAIREPTGALLEDIHGCSTVHDWRRMIDIILEVQDDDSRSEFEPLSPHPR